MDKRRKISKSCPCCSFNLRNNINLNQSSRQPVCITSFRGNRSPARLTNQRAHKTMGTQQKDKLNLRCRHMNVDSE